MDINDNNSNNSNKKLINGGFQNNFDKQLFELRGMGINRWEPLFFNPQKNCIEPFQRNGANTVLFSLDKHISECGNK